MQDGHVETGFGSQIAELISDAGCCPHLGRFSPRNFLKRQRPQVTRPVATRKDVQAFLQQVRHAWLWEAGMQCNASYILVYKHLHRLSIHHLVSTCRTQQNALTPLWIATPASCS